MARKLPLRTKSTGALAARLIAGFVDGSDGGAAVGLAHDARMHHAVAHHVVDEGGVAENLSRQIEARAALADALEIRDRLARAAAGRLDRRFTAPASVQ